MSILGSFDDFSNSLISLQKENNKLFKEYETKSQKIFTKDGKTFFGWIKMKIPSALKISLIFQDNDGNDQQSISLKIRD